MNSIEKIEKILSDQKRDKEIKNVANL